MSSYVACNCILCDYETYRDYVSEGRIAYSHPSLAEPRLLALIAQGEGPPDKGPAPAP
jgi:hypothetical protein